MYIKKILSFPFNIFLLVGLISNSLQSVETEKSIVVVSAGFNNKKWYKKHLNSIFSQNYSNFRLIYIDDCSTDRTGILVEKYLIKKGWAKKTTLIQNKKNLGATANYYMGIYLCDDTDIVVNLDADDWLAHENVLTRINQEYTNNDIWLTYGSHDSIPKGFVNPCKPYPKEVIDNNSFRNHSWRASHLRTYYAGLFKKIKKEDLMYEGEFFPMTYDMAFMFPMLEMARGHCMCINEILYIYNRLSEINDDKINRKLQKECDIFIRNKTPYEKIDSPF